LARPRRIDVVGIARYVILTVVAAAILLPLVYAVLGGAKENGQLVGDPVSLIPSPWVLSNYTDVLFGVSSKDFWQEFYNSLVIAAIAVSVTVIFASLAAFTFARMVFRGREAIYTLFTLGLLFPSAVAILPLFVLIRELGLTGSQLGVALPQAAFGLPLTIIILRPFFRSIPVELEDAAKIDGCSTFGFFWRVLLPLARPALATVSVLAFINTWNAFMLPLIVLGDESTWTLPLGVMNFSGQYVRDQALILAYTVTAIIPAIIFYIFAERQLVGGLTGGAVKG
jgi:raffinose/stachyose/melibiose transport system permease protein